jgi:hypothetical protein
LRTEYETLVTLVSSSGVKKHKLHVPACHCCGKDLLQLVVRPNSLGLSVFVYEHLPSTYRKTFCSSECGNYSPLLANTDIIRNTDNYYPSEAFADGVSVAESHSMQAEQYNNHVESVEGENGCVIRAASAISAGSVICGVIGTICKSAGEQQADEEQKSDPLFLELNDVEQGKKLLVDSRSLVAHMQRSTKGSNVKSNARVFAHYSLLQREDAPLVKSHTLVPGAYVIVAESSIGRGEPIVLQWPEKNIAPEPRDAMAQQLSVSPVASLDLSDGIMRLPGDVPFLIANDPPDFQELHASNSEKHAAGLQGWLAGVSEELKRGLPTRLKTSYAALVKAASKEQLNAGALDGGLVHVASFRDAVIPLVPVEHLKKEGDEDAGVDTAGFLQRLSECKRSKQGSKRSSRATSGKMLGGSDEGEMDESRFKDESEQEHAKWYVERAVNLSLDDLRQIHAATPITIVNRKYCKQLHCVLTTADSRKSLSALAQQIALASCSQLFNTASLNEEPFSANLECMQAWLDAVLAAIQHPQLTATLQCIAKVAQDDFNILFYPWVIVKSLCALALEIDCQKLMRNKIDGRPCTVAHRHLFLCVCVCVLTCSCAGCIQQKKAEPTPSPPPSSLWGQVSHEGAADDQSGAAPMRQSSNKYTQQ